MCCNKFAHVLVFPLKAETQVCPVQKSLLDIHHVGSTTRKLNFVPLVQLQQQGYFCCFFFFLPPPSHHVPNPLIPLISSHTHHKVWIGYQDPKYKAVIFLHTNTPTRCKLEKLHFRFHVKILPQSVYFFF